MRRLLTGVAGAGAMLAISAPAFAQATATTEVTRTPIAGPQGNPCTGEVVFITGTVLLVIHETENAGGGTRRIVHANFQGVQGVSETGTRYVQAVASNEIEGGNDQGQSNFTFVDRTRLVSQTSTDNFLASLTFHVTTNANGEVTAEHEFSDAECAG